MSMSVPGNNCRTNRCCVPPTQGCLVKVPGECTYYSGTTIAGPGINTGDNLNTLITKIINYVSGAAFDIRAYTSSNFALDGITVNDPALSGRTFEIFLNDLNRFMYNELGNKEWDYVIGGGFKILIPGFDASLNNYHLYLFPKA